MLEERGITIDRINECFDINPDTGEMIWKWRPGVPDKINKRHAEKPAAKGLSTHGYYRVKIDGVRFHAHRVAYALYHGHWPEGDIDHRNGIKTDNSKANLRDVPHRINLRNSKMCIANTSGITGVGFHKASGRYRATAALNGKQVHLGIFDTVDEALCARLEFNQKHEFTERHGA